MDHALLVMPYLYKGMDLFRAVSHCMHNTEKRLSEIRLSIVNKIINEWEYYANFSVDLLKVNSAENYKYLFSRDGENGVSVELTFISFLN